MIANSAQWVVEFLGGPLDGLVLSDSEFRAHTERRLPTLAQEQRHESSPDDLRRDWLMAYRFTGEPAATTNDCSLPRVRYDFLGHERAAGESEKQSASPRPLDMRRWLSRLGRKIGAWMFEPIDHPLRVSVGRNRSPHASASFGIHGGFLANVSSL